MPHFSKNRGILRAEAMYMKQEDRVRQTKQAFRMALLHFLQEKPINKVTIADLTGFTGYNRSTFYLYYHDIYELKDDLEHTVLEEIHARMVRHPLEEMKESIVPLIYDLFDYADRNREVFHTLSNNKSYRELTDGVYALLRDFCYSSWDQVFPGANKEKYDLYFHFISSGMTSAVFYWITDGKETIDEVARATAEMVYAGNKILFDD